MPHWPPAPPPRREGMRTGRWQAPGRADASWTFNLGFRWNHDFTGSIVGPRGAAASCRFRLRVSLPGNVMTQAAMKRARRIRTCAGTVVRSIGLALLVAAPAMAGET